MQDQQISSLHLKLEPENPKYIAAFVGELNGKIKLIEDKKLGIGAVVKIIRSGDVIPYIMEVTQPATEVKLRSFSRLEIFRLPKRYVI